MSSVAPETDVHAARTGWRFRVACEERLAGGGHQGHEVLLARRGLPVLREQQEPRARQVRRDRPAHPGRPLRCCAG